MINPVRHTCSIIGLADLFQDRAEQVALGRDREDGGEDHLIDVLPALEKRRSMCPATGPTSGFRSELDDLYEACKQGQ